ncbi:HWE histidine kinase domain-containing protein [Caenispirillum bisanense]|uniref:HWE histidine kinase domain-containing protein n=1 Tax=Caenispirillum bisanense TaxID=414052 RepID=UPI0031DBBD90
MPASTLSSSVDLTTCDREPIHLLGKVQRHGFLLGAAADWTITHASHNVVDFLGRTAEDMVGRPFRELFDGDTLHALRNRLQFATGHHGSEVVSRLPVGPEGQLYDVAVHLSADTIVTEFMPHAPGEAVDDALAMVRSLIDRLSAAPTPQRLCEDAARYVRMFTGFDRVMVYRFLPDGSGQVTAEARERSMEPFLHLRYPATDIPQQARQLYLHNTIRVIADAGDDGCRVYPSRDRDGRVLDLSDSVLRSVSDIHLQYLRNMGVGASMSISIIVDNALWGLIACHHRTPLVLGHASRLGAQLFGQMFSLVLQTKLDAAERRHDDDVRRLSAQVAAAMAPDRPAAEVLLDYAAAFCPLMRAHGAAVVLDGRLLTHGVAPAAEHIAAITRLLDGSPVNMIFATDHLSAEVPEAAAWTGEAAGLLAVPISRTPRDYVLFFRPEVIQQVTWAGNPDKVAEPGADDQRLSPRRSFAAWKTAVAGRSETWDRAQVRMAEQLRLVLLDVVLRLGDEAARVRDRAGEKQELLIAELNHRVRNIMGVVRGLIRQTGWSEDSAERFAEILDSRIQALARAHDQITRENWGPGSLTTLIRVEAQSFLVDNQARVRVRGDDMLLAPAALSTLALVIHELMTNSAKYGALTDQRGHVEVTLTPEPDGALTLDWLEVGGPPVQPPARRGFGSTIIERTIPFELRGRAQVDYAPQGLAARFWVPAAFVHRAGSRHQAAAAAAGTGAAGAGAGQPVAAPLRVLVVEDNLIIALDAETAFLSLGCEQVTLAGSNGQAAQLLAAEQFDFALLDVNLGPETSFPTAAALQADGVPFAFATGYGDASEYPAEMQAVPRLTKPYDLDMIRGLLATLTAPRG